MEKENCPLMGKSDFAERFRNFAERFREALKAGSIDVDVESNLGHPDQIVTSSDSCKCLQKTDGQHHGGLIDCQLGLGDPDQVVRSFDSYKILMSSHSCCKSKQTFATKRERLGARQSIAASIRPDQIINS